ncbi:MAG: hypothetical protein IJS73_01230 [Paludibacteraceae bacterium]|nr:hypothetical protein [Paludibacteraceae bacterium]
MDRNDIEIIEISTNTDFSYAGKVFHGLKGLVKASFSYYDEERKKQGAPYVVEISKLYPCFDSEDYMNENRFYQNFYFTCDPQKAENICKETQAGYRFNNKVLFPILEPRFSMSRIEEYHLPYIYYHGEGFFMQIVQNRNAKPEDKITIL